MRAVVESGTDTLEGRQVRYEITAGFYKWELEYKGKAWDVATGIMGKSKGFKSSTTASREAMADLRARLSSAGHLGTPSEKPLPPLTSSSAAPGLSSSLSASHFSTLSEQPLPGTPSSTPLTTAQLPGVEWTSYAPIASAFLIVLATTICIMAYAYRKKGSSAKVGRTVEVHPNPRTNHREVQIRTMMDKLGSDVYPKWQLFATELGINHGIIDAIDRRERGDDQMCFRRVLVEWSNSPPPEYPFTMESAVRILRKPVINLKKLAKEIEEMEMTDR